MDTTRLRRLVWRGSLGLAALAAPMHAGAADGDVQRQFQQREQQQMELRLKMQQQLDRATRGPQTPSAGLQTQTFERDQQQRLQQFHDQQLRGSIPPAAGNAEQMRRDIERQRTVKGSAMELNRSGSERQLETIDRGNGP